MNILHRRRPAWRFVLAHRWWSTVTAVAEDLFFGIDKFSSPMNGFGNERTMYG